MAIVFSILLMIGVGGTTRLTQSGLSIVEWAPLMGAIPPLSEAEWELVFSKYREFPQYKIDFPTMTVGEFKAIFFWEYLHRLIGRLIGAVVLVPLVWWAVRRRISPRLAMLAGFGLFLGGLQGFLGWYMVKSGLVKDPRVSHYRLASHLLLAVLCLTYFFVLWIRTHPGSVKPGTGWRWPHRGVLLGIGILAVFQLAYGALVAGLRAGRIFNTFPKMGDGWWPPQFWVVEPAWRNFFENAAVVQFVHRLLAYVILMGAAGWGLAAWRRTRRPEAWLPLAMALVQVVLGVVTLLLVVPVPLGVFHQVFGVLFFLSLAWIWERGREALQISNNK